jgi:hypothetical protein
VDLSKRRATIAGSRTPMPTTNRTSEEPKALTAEDQAFFQRKNLEAQNSKLKNMFEESCKFEEIFSHLTKCASC